MTCNGYNVLYYPHTRDYLKACLTTTFYDGENCFETGGVGNQASNIKNRIVGGPLAKVRMITLWKRNVFPISYSH